MPSLMSGDWPGLSWSNSECQAQCLLSASRLAWACPHRGGHRVHKSGKRRQVSMHKHFFNPVHVKMTNILLLSAKATWTSPYQG